MRQEIRFCSADDGVRIAYALAGDGSPVVKAANWLNHLEFDWESPIWRHTLKPIARRHLLVRYDERGSGLSDWEASDLTFEAWVRDLETVVDAAELERFALFGISQGCAVSIAYAVRHPERVSRLVLYGGYARGWRARGDADEIEVRQAMHVLMKKGWGVDNPAFRQIFTSRFVPGGTQEQMTWFNDLQRMTSSAENAVRLSLATGDIDVLDLLPRIEAPTLVLHARDDAVVGSRAWGLADESSDEDVRGWFLLPFEESVSLWHAPDEIQSPDSDRAYWEIEKLLYQALRADANTLECLWSPVHKKTTPLGESLLEIRNSFISMNVLGSFGRYAESQFKKIERSELRNAAIAELLEAIESRGLSRTEDAETFLRERGVAKTAARAREEVKVVYRSLFDRALLSESTFESLVREVVEGRRKSLEPAPHRPKNAYNLLRLLHSCLHCLRTGEPLIRVEGELKRTLLAIKSQQMPLEKILALARELAREIDDEAKVSSLPEKPDFEAADAFLKRCRRDAARRSLGLGRAPVVTASSEHQDYRPTVLPVEPFVACTCWTTPSTLSTTTTVTTVVLDTTVVTIAPPGTRGTNISSRPRPFQGNALRRSESVAISVIGSISEGLNPKYR